MYYIDDVLVEIKPFLIILRADYDMVITWTDLKRNSHFEQKYNVNLVYRVNYINIVFNNIEDVIQWDYMKEMLNDIVKSIRD